MVRRPGPGEVGRSVLRSRGWPLRPLQVVHASDGPPDAPDGDQEQPVSGDADLAAPGGQASRWSPPAATERVDVAPPPRGEPTGPGVADDAPQPLAAPAGEASSPSGPAHGAIAGPGPSSSLADRDREDPRSPARWGHGDGPPGGFAAGTATVAPPADSRSSTPFVAGPGGSGPAPTGVAPDASPPRSEDGASEGGLPAGSAVSAQDERDELVAAAPAESTVSSHAEQLERESAALGVAPELTGHDGAGGHGAPAEDADPSAAGAIGIPAGLEADAPTDPPSGEGVSAAQADPAVPDAAASDARTHGAGPAADPRTTPGGGGAGSPEPTSGPDVDAAAAVDAPESDVPAEPSVAEPAPGRGAVSDAGSGAGVEPRPATPSAGRPAGGTAPVSAEDDPWVRSAAEAALDAEDRAQGEVPARAPTGPGGDPSPDEAPAASTTAPAPSAPAPATEAAPRERRQPAGLGNLRLPERTVAPETPTTRAIVVGVANQKGGVGKTTTTVSLAAAVAQAGVRTLVVDLDPQGNATTGLGRRAEEGDPSSYGVLVDELPVEEALQATEVDKLDVLPSSLDLAGAEVELVPAFSRELRLRRALAPVLGRYDLILIDCPPSLGLLTINALVAADQVVVPIQCEYYALEGLGQLMRTVQLVGDNLNRDLELGGVVLTMFDGRTKLSQQVVDEVRAYFGETAYETVIPRTVRLSEAPSFGQPITVFDPSSRGSRAYERLAHEVIARLGLPSDAPPEPPDGRSALDRLLGGPTPAGGSGATPEVGDATEAAPGNPPPVPPTSSPEQRPEGQP